MARDIRRRLSKLEESIGILDLPFDKPLSEWTNEQLEAYVRQNNPHYRPIEEYSDEELEYIIETGRLPEESYLQE